MSTPAHFLALLRARRERPCRRRAAEKRDEVAPSNVTCHASLPRRHAQSKQYYIVIRSFASVARWSRYVRRPISRVVEKVPSALYADVTPLKLNPQRR